MLVQSFENLTSPPVCAKANTVLVYSDAGELLMVAGTVFDTVLLSHCHEPDFERCLGLLGLDRTDFRTPAVLNDSTQGPVIRVVEPQGT